MKRLKKQDQLGILQRLRSMTSEDVVIETFVRVAEVTARSEMIGTQLSQEFIDESIIDNHMKSMLLSIISFQSMRIAALESELRENIE